MDTTLLPPDDARLFPLAPLGALSSEARAFARASLSRATRRVYEHHWSAFLRWCASRGCSPLPADPTAVADYIAARALKGVSLAEAPARKGPKGRLYPARSPWGPSMIGQALAAIGKAHELAGHYSPRRHIAVRAVWAGIAREKGLAPLRRAAPLLVPDLREKITRAFPPTLRGARNMALLLLGFGAALRRSELAALRREDVAFEPRGLALTVRRHEVGPSGETAAGSKADQEGRGQVVAVHRAEGAVCPVRAVEIWIERGKIEEPGLPLFRRVLPSGVGERGLTGGQIARIVKRVAWGLGLENPDDYSGHSLRAGLATSAARAGRPLWAIQRQTRHVKLDTLANYIRSILAFDDNVTKGLF